MHKVDNAVILAAGTSSRFAPLSYEMPKGLISVRGEVLIERQIRQLKEVGIDQIVVVTGYLKEQFEYLAKEYGVILINNDEYCTRNNNSSIWAARDYLRNSYICSSDNYFTSNPFESAVEDAYYSAIYSEGYTKEWCLRVDDDGNINKVSIGGRDAWYMLGQVFWTREFSAQFLRILEAEYDLPATRDKLWESIFMEHLDTLKMKVRKYTADSIFEFDTLDELREFDPTFCKHSGSRIMEEVAETLGGTEEEMSGIEVIKGPDGEAAGFSFLFRSEQYQYRYKTKKLNRC